MNNALTPLTYELSPANPQWYAARVTFLDKTPVTGFNIEKLSTMYHHEQGFRTIISNIDVNFYQSHLITIDAPDIENIYIDNVEFPTTLVNKNEYLDYYPLFYYLYNQLQSATGLYYPMTRNSFIINKDSYDTFFKSIDYEILEKKYINRVSLNNKCGNSFQDVYYTQNPSGRDPWYGPFKNTPIYSNIEFVMDSSINESLTYLFIESVYNIINNLPQRSVVQYIVSKEWNSRYFEDLTSTDLSSLLNEFNNDTSIVQKPLEFIIFIHFPYVQIKTRKHFDVEVFGNRVLNMNPLKPSPSNIKNKPDYRRF